MKRKLPKNWRYTTISTLIGPDGLFKDGDWVESKDQDINGDVRLIQLADIGAGEFRDKSDRWLTLEKSIELRCSYLEKDDILIARMPDPIGRACLFPYEGLFVTVVDVAIVRPCPSAVNPKWLMYFINSPGLNLRISDLSSGSTRKRISRKNLDKIDIPFPPLPEQKRIVAKLDKLFEQLEVINDKIKNLGEIKEKFIYSCLINTQTGQFFSRQKIGKYLEEGKERIGENWSKHRKIGVSAKKGIIDLSTGQKKSFETYKVVQPGDFIYNTMRVNIGSIAIYTGKKIAITSPDYVVFRVKDFLSSELLLGFLKSDQGLLEIGANTKGSVRARLYFKSLSEIRMPVSDQKTQIIAEKFLTTYSHLLRKLKKISKTKLVDLEKAILTKAFKGELVPQMESEGDARDLLEEIEKMRKAGGTKIKNGKPKIKKYETSDVGLSRAAEGIEKYAK